MSSDGGSNEVEIRNINAALIGLRSDMRLLLGGGVLLLSAIVSSHLILRDEIRVEIVGLRAKDDIIIDRLSKIETSVAVLIERSEDREAQQPITPSDKRDAKRSSDRREALH